MEAASWMEGGLEGASCVCTPLRAAMEAAGRLRSLRWEALVSGEAPDLDRAGAALPAALELRGEGARRAFASGCVPELGVALRLRPLGTPEFTMSSVKEGTAASSPQGLGE